MELSTFNILIQKALENNLNLNQFAHIFNNMKAITKL